MEFTQVLSWIGTLLGLSIGIPQIIKSIRTKSTKDVSATTFVLIVLTGLCFLVRAVAIKEPAFICYYALIIISGIIQLYLIRKYSRPSQLADEPNTRNRTG